MAKERSKKHMPSTKSAPHSQRPHTLEPLSAMEAMFKRVDDHGRTKRDSDAAQFFSLPAEKTVGFHHCFMPHEHITVQDAVRAILAGWRRVEADGSTRLSLHSRKYRQVEVVSGTFRSCHVETYEGFLSPDGIKLLVGYDYPLAVYREVSVLDIWCAAEHRERAEEITAQVVRYVETHDYLKGQTITAEGAFAKLAREYTWNDLILPPEAKARLILEADSFMRMAGLCSRRGLPCKRGIILHGPPGTGKTLTGKILSCQYETTFIWATAGDVMEREGVGKTFALARKLAPTILMIEDIDLFASARNESPAPVLGEFLAQLDGFWEKEPLLVIATTNHLDTVDPAVRDRPSRFDTLIEFGPLDADLGAEVLRRELARQGFELPEGLNLRGRLKGMTGAQVVEVAAGAMHLALARQSAAPENACALETTDIESALGRIRKTKPAAGFGREG